jgi:hypothetical protein
MTEFKFNGIAYAGLAGEKQASRHFSPVTARAAQPRASFKSPADVTVIADKDPEAPAPTKKVSTPRFNQFDGMYDCKRQPRDQPDQPCRCRA